MLYFTLNDVAFFRNQIFSCMAIPDFLISLINFLPEKNYCSHPSVLKYRCDIIFKYVQHGELNSPVGTVHVNAEIQQFTQYVPWQHR